MYINLFFFACSSEKQTINSGFYLFVAEKRAKKAKKGKRKKQKTKTSNTCKTSGTRKLLKCQAVYNYYR